MNKFEKMNELLKSISTNSEVTSQKNEKVKNHIKKITYFSKNGSVCMSITHIKSHPRMP